MALKKLTTTEERVIGQLDLDARKRFRQIGRTVRKSEQNVSYTVNNLLKKGVISGFQTLIDYSRLSVLNFRVYFSINYINEESFDRFKNFLVEDPHTMWVVTCGSRYDLLCTFAFRNPSQFNKYLRKIMSRFARQVQEYTVLTTIVVRALNRKYMLSRRGSHTLFMIGGDREPYDLPEKDLRLLGEIADDARKGSVEISRKIHCDPRTVINRLRTLEKMGIIKGYRPFIDFSKIDYVKNLLLVRYHNISVDDEKTLIDYLNTHPNVVCVTKTLGEWDLEISIEAKSMLDFRKVERHLRSKFSGIIYRTETVPIYKEHKMTFFPRFLMEDQNNAK